MKFKKLMNRRFLIHALIWLGAAALVSGVDELEDYVHDRIEKKHKKKELAESEQPTS